MPLKELLGLVASIIAVVSYIPYLRDVISGKTKPHIFSWAMWEILTLIGLAAQLSDNPGPGAWAPAVTSVVCAVVIGFSLKNGKKNITKIDVVMLVMSFMAMLAWLVTKQPILSVVLIIAVDALAFFPTIRKSWNAPHEETLSLFALAGIKHLISLFALTNFTVVTALYSSYLVVVNFLFITMLFFRRRQLQSS